MIVRAEVNSYEANVKNLTEEQIEKLRVLFPDATLISGQYLSGVDEMVDLYALVDICSELGLKFTVRPHKGNAFFAQSRTRGIEKRLDALSQELESLKSGAVVQMHVPNFSLLMFNRVEVREDCCTDELQKLLNSGWRILAICPPLSERRPTYILGRYVPE